MINRACILVDMDSILADLLPKWLAAYNAASGKNITVDDVTDWNMEKCLGEPDIARFIHEPGFFEDLAPIPGGVEAIERFIDEGHRVHVVTAPASPESAAEKLRWLKRHIPELRSNAVIITGAKHLVRGHVFIDDAPHQAVRYRKFWPPAFIATIGYPYNRATEAYDLVAGSHRDPRAAWEEITRAVLNFVDAEET